MNFSFLPIRFCGIPPKKNSSKTFSFSIQTPVKLDLKNSFETSFNYKIPNINNHCQCHISIGNHIARKRGDMTPWQSYLLFQDFNSALINSIKVRVTTYGLIWKCSLNSFNVQLYSSVARQLLSIFFFSNLL